MPDDDSYPTHGWGALAADPWMPVGADGPEYREILRRIWLRQGGTNEAFESLMPAKPASDGTTYPPEALRVLQGMSPPRRPDGHVENPEGIADFDPADDPEYRAFLQGYSDRLRDSHGLPRRRLGNDDDA